ncbi:hypothetical protein AYI69_g1308 [Smittium culicis]|uniref:Uncharacterized protein n=1 Tax=Smittium culicis TaxID=133412 RepID=A0A1R1YQL9_9FUNG|nr:hypothetical protein AYI69_g1308 [Smittium culicis]
MDLVTEDDFVSSEKIMRIIRVVIGKVRHAIHIVQKTPSIINSIESLNHTSKTEDFLASDYLLNPDSAISDDDFYDSSSPIISRKRRTSFSFNDKIKETGFLRTLIKSKSNDKRAPLNKYGGKKKPVTKSTRLSQARKIDYRESEFSFSLSSDDYESFPENDAKSSSYHRFPKFYSNYHRKKSKNTALSSIKRSDSQPTYPTLSKPEDWFISPRKNSDSGLSSLRHNSDIIISPGLSSKRSFNKKSIRKSKDFLNLWSKLYKSKVKASSLFSIPNELKFLYSSLCSCFEFLWLDWVESIVKNEKYIAIFWSDGAFMGSQGVPLKILAAFAIGNNIGINFDLDDNIEKISNSYDEIPPHLRRFVALQHIVYQVYKILHEFQLDFILIQALLSRGASFQHFWVAENTIKDSLKLKTDSKTTPKIFNEFFLNKLFKQSQIFGNGQKFLSSLKIITKNSIDINTKFYNEYINLWSFYYSIESQTRKKKIIKESRSFDGFDSDDSWDYYENLEDDRKDHKFTASSSIPPYIKWLMRLPEVIGSSGLLFLAFESILKSTIHIFQDPTSIDTSLKHSKLVVVGKLLSTICIKLCNSNIGLLNYNCKNPGAVLDSQSILYKDPVPSFEYLENFLCEANRILTHTSELKHLILSPKTKLSSFNKSLKNKKDSPLDSYSIDSNDSIFFSDFNITELSFSMLSISYYSKYFVSSSEIFNQTTDYRSSKNAKNPVLRSIILKVKNILYDINHPDRIKSRKFELYHENSSPKFKADVDKKLISNFFGKVVDRLIFWGLAPKDFLNIASIFDAADLLVEAKAFLFEVWKRYDDLTVRNKKVSEMRNKWELGDEKVNANTNVADSCNLKVFETPGFEPILENAKMANNNITQKGFLFSDLNRSSIVDYLEALDIKIKNMLSKSKHQRTPINEPRTSTKRTVPIIRNLKHSRVDYLSDDPVDELEFIQPEFSFATPLSDLEPKRAVKVAKKSSAKSQRSINRKLPHSPAEIESGDFSPLFDNSVEKYLLTPMRSPHSVYPFLKSINYASTPSKNKK